jgi:NitT/TauT family transport system substrate-binding protein
LTYVTALGACGADFGSSVDTVTIVVEDATRSNPNTNHNIEGGNGMSKTVSRRRFLEGAGTSGLALGAGIIGAPNLAFGAGPTTLKTATLAGGWSNMQNQVLFKNKFDEKNGLKFDSFRVYNRLGTYYADFLKGNFQIGVGTWDSFANMHLKGAPMQVVGIVSTGTLAGFFARADGPNSLEELKGKTLAAMQASGTFKMAKTWTKVFAGIDFDSDVSIQNAPNPPATVNIVAANRADAAIVWEHALSTGLHKIPGSKVFLNVNDFYRKHTGRDQPYFCIAINRAALGDVPKDTISRAVKAYTDSFEWMMANQAEFQALGPSVRIKPEVLKTAMDSGRLQWQMRPMSVEKNREDVHFAAEIMRKAGALPGKLPESYFAS